VLPTTVPISLVGLHLGTILGPIQRWAGFECICGCAGACRRFATFSASSELPMTVEDSMLFWLNKSVSALHKRVGIDMPAKQLTDLRQLCDGLFLASAVSFYCSADFPFEGTDVC